MAESRFTVPAGFTWGTATASYQIEGAAYEDGRKPSIWDTFSHTPGRVKNGDTGDVAADHYHHWREDIELMKSLNISAYRLSIAWPRIYPEGRGTLNQPGLDFYSRLIDGLLDANITPYVTLYHWDLPQALQDEGGWVRRGIVDDFVAYADIVTRTLGDRVKNWITFNEPWVFTWLGYAIGIHAPGYQTDDPRPALQASHHVNLAHGRTVPLIRQNAPGARVGTTLSLSHVDAASDSADDIAAARRHDGYVNRWYLDPVLLGRYPEDMLDTFAEFLPVIQEGDMQTIYQPLDFLGVNYYTRNVIKDAPEKPILQSTQIRQDGNPHTEMDWEIYPNGLYQLLKRLNADYQPKALYITENGAAFEDVVSEDGRVHDAERVAYLEEHFAAALRAREEGVPLEGYFVWSLMDNFEWAEGYNKRFGVTYIDYETQARIIKDSGYYLAEVAAATEPVPE
jgi:beta-glucosidase